MNRIELNVIWTDDDEMFQLGITIASRSHSAYHETYVYPRELASFADSLKSFPKSTISEALLVCGGQDPKCHDFISMRVFVLRPTGYSALEFKSEVRGSPPTQAECHFFVPGMPADFNRLGSAVSDWLNNPNEKLMFEWQDA